MEVKGKKVLVFGLGISGIGAGQILERHGAEVIMYDGNQKLTEEKIKKQLGEDSSAKIVIGDFPEEVLEKLDMTVLSPGVPTDLPVIEKMREQGITVIGEVELAYQFGKGDVLAITGTNGKTTTTTLLGEIMKNYQEDVFVVGNIGTPYTTAVEKMTDNTITVAEMSSFQLESIVDFRPRVSAILNFTPDHLNRHHTMEEYIRVKELITGNQTKDQVCVLNYEDEVLRAFGESGQVKAKVVYFSSLRELPQGIFLRGKEIVLRAGEKEFVITTTDRLKILGRHNHENTMAAAAMAYYAGVPVENIKKSVENFVAVEHRIEYVTEKNGVVYYNDSKGTNPDAAIKGIQAMDRPTLLIGGGYDKQSSYDEWIEAFDGKVRFLVLIGQTREKIEETAHKCGFMNTILADNLEEAVKICAEKANKGDAVLLSPACASWGMFTNYEERGRIFKDIVRSLKE